MSETPEPQIKSISMSLAYSGRVKDAAELYGVDAKTARARISNGQMLDASGIGTVGPDGRTFTLPRDTQGVVPEHLSGTIAVRMTDGKHPQLYVWPAPPYTTATFKIRVTGTRSGKADWCLL